MPMNTGWQFMQDGIVFAEFNHQGGPRGGNEFVVPNWWMGMASRKTAPVRREAAARLASLEPEQFIRDPYVLEFLDLRDYPALREWSVEQSIIENLQAFLLESGRGFSFVARQRRMRFEEEDFYVDLVFYNYLLKCFVLIDLKVGKLTHQDIGQMDGYVRMFDAHARPAGDNPTILSLIHI